MDILNFVRALAILSVPSLAFAFAVVLTAKSYDRKSPALVLLFGPANLVAIIGLVIHKVGFAALTATLAVTVLSVFYMFLLVLLFWPTWTKEVYRRVKES